MLAGWGRGGRQWVRRRRLRRRREVGLFAGFLHVGAPSTAGRARPSFCLKESGRDGGAGGDGTPGGSFRSSAGQTTTELAPQGLLGRSGAEETPHKRFLSTRDATNVGDEVLQPGFVRTS